MKKLLLLFLVLAAGMMNANAQRTESGKIKVYFCDPTGKWEASHFYIYVFETSTNHNDNWPGVDVTNNTIDYDGKTWYYREFDTNTYGEGFKVVFVNNSGTVGEGQSQSVDISWDLKGTNGIYNDSYYILQDNWTDDGKREATHQVTYYMCKTDDSSVTRLDKDGTTYSTTIEMQGSNDPQYYVVLSPYGFKNYNQIDWDQKNDIYRPNSDVEVLYQNSTNVNVNRGEDSGSWRFHAPVNYNFSIVIDNWVSETYSIEPFINKTISAAGYATIASKGCLNFDGVSGLVGQIGTMTDNTVNFTNVNDVPANTGVLLKGAAGEYKIGFVNSSSTVVSNNVLVGVTAETQIADMTEGKTNFVLMNGNSGVGFYKVSAAGFTVGANTAYLSTAISGNAKSFIAVEGGETTGISTIDNGQLTMENVYDLQGRKVMNPTKGLYIVNGKKVVLK